MGIKIVVIGNRTKTIPTLYVANHISYIDILIMGATIKGSFISKGAVAKWPVIGWLTNLQKTIYVDRSIAELKSKSSELIERLHDKNNLMLFPEGTSSDGNRVLKFKSALFNVADQKIDGDYLNVQPISICYNFLDGFPICRQLKPFYAWYGDMDLLSHLWTMAGLGKLTVTLQFHEPTSLARHSSRKEIAQYCEEQVRKGFSESKYTKNTKINLLERLKKKQIVQK